jgi:hypothetical protein
LHQSHVYLFVAWVVVVDNPVVPYPMVVVVVHTTVAAVDNQAYSDMNLVDNLVLTYIYP